MRATDYTRPMRAGRPYRGKTKQLSRFGFALEAMHCYDKVHTIEG